MRGFSGLRRLRILLPVLAGLLLFALTGLAQDSGSGGGTWLERQLESLVPGLRVEGLEGTWRAQPTARRITLSDARGVWLVLERARLDLAPTALLRGVLRLESLEADLLRLERLPESNPAAAPAQPTSGGFLQLPELPVDVSIDRLEVRRLELEPAVAGQAAAFSLGGQAALRSGSLQAKLDLRRLDAEGSATADIALTPASGRLSAEVALREAAGGLVPSLLGLPQHPLVLDLRLQGPASGAALTLEAGLGPEIALSTRGEVRATPDGAFGARLEGQARAAPLLPPDLAPLATPAQFSLDADLPANRRLALRSLRLGLPAGQVSASGSADLASEALDLRLILDLAESARFAALLPAGIGWTGAHAEARIGGTISRPEVSLEAVPEGLATGIPQADAVLGPTPRLTLQAALPGPSLDLVLAGAAGRLAAEGSLAEPLALQARLSLPRLSVLGPGSEGALEAVVQASGSLADPTLVITAESGRIEAAGRVLEALRLQARVETPLSAPRVQADLAGRLAEMPLSLALRGQPEGGKLRLEQGEARLGPARLSLTGLLDPAAALFDGTARLEATDLAPLGRLAGLADLAGRLVLEARLNPTAQGLQGFNARLDAPRLALAGTEGSLQATASGTPAALDWAVQGRADMGAVSGRGSLASANGGWRLNLAALEAQAMGEALRLAAPARVALGAAGGVEVPGLALAIQGGGQVRAAGRWGPERADLTVTLSALPVALAERFVPDLQPQGTVSGEVRVTGPVGRPEIKATLQGSGLRSGANWALGLPTLALRAEASMAGEAAQLRAEIDAGPAGRLTATARLPGGFGPQAPLAAALEGNLALAPLAGPFLAAGADRVSGRIAVALRAEGTVGTPQLGGRATLSGGGYRNAEYGVRIDNLAGTVVGDGTRLVIQQLQGRTPGGGSITVSGSLDAGAPGLPADITLTARNARPVTSDLVTATLGADLRLTGPLLGGGSLAGEVRVQQAEIRVPERLPASVPTLTNVRQIGRRPGAAAAPPPPPPAAVTPAAPPINLAVRVLAPGRVFIRGRGIDVEMGGEVAIGGTAAAPVPQGQLTLRSGTLDVLARRLTFQRGTIGFVSGTLTPQLDLTATAQARQTTITVKVQGTPAAPEVTFTSTPELPQDEILARLLFDRATSNLSPFEIVQLASAIGQLTGIGGGTSALDRVRGALGLDRLGITSDTAGTGAAVEAGRYVAPGVFLGVRQGQSGQTGVGVQVEITPRLKLEGQTATGPAGDRIGLSYELEY